MTIVWRKRDEFGVLGILVNKWVKGERLVSEGKGHLFAFI